VGPTAGLDAVAKRKIPPLLLPVIQLRSLYMHNFVCKNFFVSYELKLWRRCKTLRLCLITCTQLGLYTTRNCTELLTYLLTYLLTHSLHGSGYYLKADCYSARQKISRFLTEPEGSSPCSQKPATGPYPEPSESSSPHRSLSHQGPS
jgi:hypothetical protein